MASNWKTGLKPNELLRKGLWVRNPLKPEQHVLLPVLKKAARPRKVKKPRWRTDVLICSSNWYVITRSGKG